MRRSIRRSPVGSPGAPLAAARSRLRPPLVPGRVEERLLPTRPIAVTVALTIVVVLATLPACAPAPAGPSSPGAAVAARVVDGDTVRVRIAGRDERVRLLGIDTPETHGAGGLVECFGAEATARTKALLPPGTAVRLVRDVEARDRYGRLLAYVYRARDGLFVNLALAEEGFADVLAIAPNLAHAAELDAAVGAARAAGRGLWKRCGGPDVPVG